MKRHEEQKGIVLVAALIALLIMSIFLPALLQVIQFENRASIKQERTTTAFHLAEAGGDRGIWKLQESDTIWENASTGTVLAGYNYDQIYTSTGLDGIRGEYKVKITTGTDTGTVLIRAIGRDKGNNEVRAVEALYSKTAIKASINARGALEYKSGLHVHWGPVVSYSNITANPSEYFPRKIAKGYIGTTAGGYDGEADLPNGHDAFSTWPNPATYDFASFQTKLGNAPVIDLEQYKTISKASQCPPFRKKGGTGANCAGTQFAAAVPTGSCYFTDQIEFA